MPRKSLIYFPYDTDVPPISGANLEQIRSLKVFWDDLEEGAPGLRHADGSEIADANLLKDVETFLKTIKPQAKDYRGSAAHYKPTKRILKLWNQASFTGTGIDPKRPFEGANPRPEPTKRDWDGLMKLLQAVVECEVYPPPDLEIPQLTIDQFEARVFSNYLDFLEELKSAPQDARLLLFKPSNQVYPMLKKAVEVLPENVWLKFLLARVLSLNSEREEKAKLLKSIHFPDGEMLIDGQIKIKEMVEAELAMTPALHKKIKKTWAGIEKQRIENQEKFEVDGLTFEEKLYWLHLQNLLTER